MRPSGPNATLATGPALGASEAGSLRVGDGPWQHACRSGWRRPACCRRDWTTTQTLVTGPAVEAGNEASSLRVATSHSRTVRSGSPEARVGPSELNATLLTKAVPEGVSERAAVGGGIQQPDGAVLAGGRQRGAAGAEREAGVDAGGGGGS